MDAKANKSGKKVPLLHTLTNVVLFVIGLLALFSGACSLFLDPPSFAATKIAVGLILLMASTIDRFESLKALGMEAKTRKLDEKIEEASVLLGQLRQLTELSGKTLIHLYAKAGRHDGSPSPLEMMAFGRDVRSVMTAVGVDSNTIRASLSPWIWTLCLDMVHGYWSILSNLAAIKKTELENEQAAAVRENRVVGNDLNEKISALNQYMWSRNNQNWWDSVNIDNVSSSLRGLFHDLPPTVANVTALRDDANRFAADMDVFIRTAELQSEGAWVVQLNRFRNRV